MNNIFNSRHSLLNDLYTLSYSHYPIVHVVIYNKLYEKLFLNKNNVHEMNYKIELQFNINYVPPKSNH